MYGNGLIQGDRGIMKIVPQSMVVILLLKSIARIRDERVVPTGYPPGGTSEYAHQRPPPSTADGSKFGLKDIGVGVQFVPPSELTSKKTSKKEVCLMSPDSELSRTTACIPNGPRLFSDESSHVQWYGIAGGSMSWFPKSTPLIAVEISGGFGVDCAQPV